MLDFAQRFLPAQVRIPLVVTLPRKIGFIRETAREGTKKFPASLFYCGIWLPMLCKARGRRAHGLRDLGDGYGFEFAARCFGHLRQTLAEVWCSSASGALALAPRLCHQHEDRQSASPHDPAICSRGGHRDDRLRLAKCLWLTQKRSAG